MNLRPSASGWKKPIPVKNGPITGIYFTKGGAARFGPTRSWIHADILRSASTEYATIPCTTPTTIAILTRLKMMKFQSMLDLHRRSSIAQTGPGQAVEGGNILCHFVEQTFDRHKTVLAGHVVDEVMQKFPFRAGVAGRFHGLHEFLHAALGAGERPA